MGAAQPAVPTTRLNSGIVVPELWGWLNSGIVVLELPERSNLEIVVLELPEQLPELLMDHRAAVGSLEVPPVEWRAAAVVILVPAEPVRPESGAKEPDATRAGRIGCKRSRP
jgi:hypothetical protein